MARGAQLSEEEHITIRSFKSWTRRLLPSTGELKVSVNKRVQLDLCDLQYLTLYEELYALETRLGGRKRERSGRKAGGGEGQRSAACAHVVACIQQQIQSDGWCL